MTQAQVLAELARLIMAAQEDGPLRVGIDGIDAAGKTVLADTLAAHLRKDGQEVLRASIDGFHNPKQIRYRQGAYSPQGYYEDSFNYPLLKQSLLDPLAPGGDRGCRLKAFDFRSDREIPAGEIQARLRTILVFEGVFLFRPELEDCWDIRVFVDIDFETSLARALRRDRQLLGDEQEIIRKYRQRYIPGQQLYLATAQPKAKADIVIDNNDFDDPGIVFHWKK